MPMLNSSSLEPFFFNKRNAMWNANRLFQTGQLISSHRRNNSFPDASRHAEDGMMKKAAIKKYQPGY